MSNEPTFKRVRIREERRSVGADSDRAEFLARLSDGVTKRFARMTGRTAVILPIDLPGATEDSPPESLPTHPDCAEFAGTQQCQALLEAHLAELRRYPDIHWHRCAFGKYCAVVPVVWQGRCLAACKFVCPDAISEEALEHNLELLDILAEHFLAGEIELLRQLFAGGDGQHKQAVRPAPITEREARERTRHPRVHEALDYVDQHLCEPDMTVAKIAKALEMNPTYLAHLFAEHIEVRTSRYIAMRRIELAKKLLDTTNWQIKRVAYESGHANADWFSQVFRAQTGLTPRDYRRRALLA